MRFALALLLVAACSKSEPAKSAESNPSAKAAPDPATAAARASKDPAKAKEMIANGAVVIDVRTTDEYAGDHLAQATNIPLDQLGSRLADVEKLTGGVANDVWRVRVGGEIAVARLGKRSDADLAWEAALLQHLDRNGMIVPVPIAATDGRLFADGLVVMKFMPGGPPQSAADWRRVAETCRELHRLTKDWP